MNLLSRYFLSTLFITVLTLSACKEEEKQSEIILPSNLTVTIIEDADMEGLVKVRASADRTNFYSIIFSDQTGTTIKESISGVETYQFTDTGTFVIIVRAHLTADKYIETSESIKITFGILQPPVGGGGQPATGYTTPLSYPNYSLVWNDEFSDTVLNTTNWNYEIGTGNGGWGNNELQYYRQENTSVANGVLVIEAKNEFFNSKNYTSSRLTTQNKQSFVYGRMDIRAAMPYGQGMWPAIWMLGDNFATDGWPTCGEIDIMEMVGGLTTTNRGDGITHGTAHWSNNGSYASSGNHQKISSGRLTDEFHVYSIIWNNQKIEWLIDDNKYYTLDITPSALSEFHQKFFFILNVAVGGNWPGSPNSSTTFPQKMYVDYVRVFQ